MFFLEVKQQILSNYLIAHEKLRNAIHFVTLNYVVTPKMFESQMTWEQ